MILKLKTTRSKIIILSMALLVVFALSALLVYPQRLIPCESIGCLKKSDPWFAEKYNSRIPYFFSYHDTKPFNKFFKPHMRQPTFIQELEYLSEQAEPLLTRRYQNCAVVGSSGNLRGADYGKRIDSHGVVIRMNEAPIKKFEKDVGSKTSIVFSNMGREPRNYSDNPMHVRITPLGYGAIQNRTRYIKNFARHIAKDGKNRFGYSNNRTGSLFERSVFLDPRFALYAQTHWFHANDVMSSDHASTGFITLVYALHACDRVSVFGFGPDERGMWDHYFPPYRPQNDKSRSHDVTYQDNFIELLAETGYITLYRGNR